MFEKLQKQSLLFICSSVVDTSWYYYSSSKLNAEIKLRFLWIFLCTNNSRRTSDSLPCWPIDDETTILDNKNANFVIELSSNIVVDIKLNCHTTSAHTTGVVCNVKKPALLAMHCGYSGCCLHFASADRWRERIRKCGSCESCGSSAWPLRLQFRLFTHIVGFETLGVQLFLPFTISCTNESKESEQFFNEIGKFPKYKDRYAPKVPYSHSLPDFRCIGLSIRGKKAVLDDFELPENLKWAYSEFRSLPMSAALWLTG